MVRKEAYLHWGCAAQEDGNDDDNIGTAYLAGQVCSQPLSNGATISFTTLSIAAVNEVAFKGPLSAANQ